MSSYIISIGSNLPTGKEMVTAACTWLGTLGSITSSTGCYTTPDAVHPHGPTYTNAIVCLVSACPAEKLNLKFKEYERQQGRVKGDPAVPVDLDIVVCDTTPLRPHDLTAPYFLAGLYLLSAHLKDRAD